ncbi:hypothetical protein ACFOHY_12005 [Rhizobium rosettiformans]|uniref:hypothetical protein n=1 Tax=Rhizobium rosettiformans TaxID=1368430 RepID=UPI00360EAB2A
MTALYDHAVALAAIDIDRVGIEDVVALPKSRLTDFDSVFAPPCLCTVTRCASGLARA